MPPVASQKDTLDRLFNHVSSSIVTINRFRNGVLVEFGCGFIVYCDSKYILVCVDQSIVKANEDIMVVFNDGKSQEAHAFQRINKHRKVILRVEALQNHTYRPVSFCEQPVGRQDVFVVAAVEIGEALGLMTGTVIAPDCTALRANGLRVRDSEHLFSMTCSAGGVNKVEKTKGEQAQIIGAAVFDMNCLLIGTIHSIHQDCWDLKYSLKASYFLNHLEEVLNARDTTVLISRGRGQNLPHQKSFTQGAGTSSQGSDSTSRKRSHGDLPKSDSRATKRSHKDLVQGNMHSIKQEAMRRALVRLVTCDQSSFSSSLPDYQILFACSTDAGTEANECMELFLAINPEEVGCSANRISVKPFDLNHFFGEDGKIYGYKNLKINVWINAISFHAYADISFQETSDGGKGITDIKLALLSIFGENLVERDDFLETFLKECQYISDVVMNGQIVKNVASDGEDSIAEIVRVELQGAAASLYSRLVPFVLLEGSTPVDVKEHGWEMLLVVKKVIHESSTSKFQLLGFAMTRHIYHCPESSHLQISQMLVLPPYQGECHILINAINSIALSDNIYDVTMEDPPDYLQQMRSSIDCLRLLTIEPIKPTLSAMVASLKEMKLPGRACGLGILPSSDLAETVRLKLKINVKQFFRCWEILMYINLDAKDRMSMEKLRACIYYRLKGEIFGSATGKKVACSSHEGKSYSKEKEVELNELVDKHLEEIAMVAENLVSHS